MTASEAVTLRIDRDELRAAGRRAHTAGKLSDEQLARIEALCEGDAPVEGKPTVDLDDESIAAGLDLDELAVEWVNVPFPQGGLISSPPPPMPVGEVSAEWLSDSVVIEGERSAEWLSDSVVIEGESSAVMLGDSAIIEAEQSAVVLGDSAIIEMERPAEWLGESQIIDAESSAVFGDSAGIAEDSRVGHDGPVRARGGMAVVAKAPVPAREAFESYVPSEEWPEPAPSDDAPSVPRPALPVVAYDRRAPLPHDHWRHVEPGDSAVREPWPSEASQGWGAPPSSDFSPETGRYAGNDRVGDEVTNAPEGWAHAGTAVVGRVESPWSDDKAITLPPPAPGAVPHHALAAAHARFGEPPNAFAGPQFGGLGFPSTHAMVAAQRVEPASPMRLPARNGTLLSAQPTNASVSGTSGFAPLHAGTKLRKPLLASDASAVLAGAAKKDDDDSATAKLNAKYPWLGPVLFAAALVLGLIGEWVISSAPAAPPPVAVAAPKIEAQVQPASVATPSITLVGAPANVR